MIDEIITHIARRQFARAVAFREGETPNAEAGDGSRERLLYLHVPFCESLCPYCSFNRVIFEETICRRYFRALRKEMSMYRELGHDFSALYVGGGTPTVLMDELIETLELARRDFSITQISVETNPNHLTDDRLDMLASAGVNRLSAGVQSFDDGLLRDMGRYSKYGSGDAIAERLSNALGRFDTLNADMIFNFPGQTETMLERDLDIILERGLDQVTWYPLMVSESTRRAVTRTLGEVKFSREKRFYDIILRRLLGRYDFSSAWCFSKKRSMIDEYIVEYNEYAGLGSGSIGYMRGRVYANTFDIEKYIRQIEAGGLPLMASRKFGTGDLVMYDFLMRLFGGNIDVRQLLDHYGPRGGAVLAAIAAPFFLAGSLRYRDGQFLLTRRGRYHWVIMMREFFTAVNNFRDYCRGETGEKGERE
ncbi:MAG TPA: coproporphyrinogen III oxidase family protein [Deltaproteobacteria bacterium]|nr:coproporphyrinogen III oxidase family protein [Deltaproteobacteria bacterium]